MTAAKPHSTAANEITQLLASGQDEQALQQQLYPLVYNQLRSMARQHIHMEKNQLTLGATALVHEVFLKLFGQQQLQWKDRQHFFLAAAQAMRRILIDAARRRNAAVRDRRLTSTLKPHDSIGDDGNLSDLLDLDHVLSNLAERDEKMTQVVMLRYFAGMTVSETAEILGISPRSINRLWTAARAWLNREMSNKARPTDTPKQEG